MVSKPYQRKYFLFFFQDILYSFLCIYVTLSQKQVFHLFVSIIYHIYHHLSLQMPFVSFMRFYCCKKITSNTLPPIFFRTAILRRARISFGNAHTTGGIQPDRVYR